MMQHRFEQWTSFEIDRLANKFRRHRYFIRSLKFVLPVTALVLAAILFIYPLLSGDDKKFVIAPVEVTGDNLPPAMVNPRFSGFDKDNEPYTINAQRAYQESEQTIRLEDITADITLKSGTWASIVTPTGHYYMDKKYLKLNDIFEIFITEKDGKTYNITGSKLEVLLDKQIIRSSQPIEGDLPMGHLKASGFTIYKDTGKISFNGRVNLLIRK